MKGSLNNSITDRNIVERNGSETQKDKMGRINETTPTNSMLFQNTTIIDENQGQDATVMETLEDDDEDLGNFGQYSLQDRYNVDNLKLLKPVRLAETNDR